MAYRNKTYICFDATNDIKSYNLMKAWKANDNLEFNFHNAHDLNEVNDDTTEQTIKKKLKDRLNNTKVVVVLIGEKTKFHHKFVKWEMEVALALDIPIIGVNLNGSKTQDALCPSVIKDKFVIYVPYGMRIVQYAIDYWPSFYHANKKEKTGAFHYLDKVYRDLGI